MQTSDVYGAKSADAVLDALHDSAMAQALDALAGVLAQAEARRLLPELKAERKRQADALPVLARDIADAAANVDALRVAMLEADHELAKLPDGVTQSPTREQVEARDYWLDQGNRRRKQWLRTRTAPEIAAGRLERARAALTLLDAKIAAIESLDVDAETLGELGRALT